MLISFLGAGQVQCFPVPRIVAAISWPILAMAWLWAATNAVYDQLTTSPVIRFSLGMRCSVPFRVMTERQRTPSHDASRKIISPSGPSQSNLRTLRRARADGNARRYFAPFSIDTCSSRLVTLCSSPISGFLWDAPRGSPPAGSATEKHSTVWLTLPVTVARAACVSSGAARRRLLLPGRPLASSCPRA